jgi:hypothetical protein
MTQPRHAPTGGESNKYDLTSVFEWPNIMVGPGGLLLLVPTYFQSRFQFYGWGCKYSNLDVEKYFCRVTILSTGGDALTPFSLTPIKPTATRKSLN